MGTPMYTGDSRISTFIGFLYGYQMSIWQHKIEETSSFPHFWYFHEWAMFKYNWRESTAGWKNIILTECGYNEELALDTFFKLFDEFKELRPVVIEKTQITERNLAFHHSDECPIKCSDQEMNIFPLHNRAEGVLLVEFSHNFGFSFFVIANNRITGTDWMKRYKNSTEAKEQIEKMFGKIESWDKLSGNLQEMMIAVS